MAQAPSVTFALWATPHSLVLSGEWFAGASAVFNDGGLGEATVEDAMRALLALSGLDETATLEDIFGTAAAHRVPVLEAGIEAVELVEGRPTANGLVTVVGTGSQVAGLQQAGGDAWEVLELSANAARSGQKSTVRDDRRALCLNQDSFAHGEHYGSDALGGRGAAHVARGRARRLGGRAVSAAEDRYHCVARPQGQAGSVARAGVAHEGRHVGAGAVGAGGDGDVVDPGAGARGRNFGGGWSAGCVCDGI